MKTFREWLKSDDNPLVNSSETVKYSMHDALKAAFDAGMALEKHNWKEKIARRKQNLNEMYGSLTRRQPFTFEE